MIFWQAQRTDDLSSPGQTNAPGRDIGNDSVGSTNGDARSNSNEQSAQQNNAQPTPALTSVAERAAAARRAVRALAAQHVGARLSCTTAEVSIDAPPGRAPRLLRPRTGLCLSWSHTYGLCCVASMPAPDATVASAAAEAASSVGIGIDAEPLLRFAQQPHSAWRLARRYFSPALCAALQRIPEQLQPQAFVRLWTLFEAHSKALGTGLAGAGRGQFDLQTLPAFLQLQGGALSPVSAPVIWHAVAAPGAGFVAVLPTTSAWAAFAFAIAAPQATDVHDCTA